MPSYRIVLVRPQHPGNLGAVARVMMNMGLTDLALVHPQCLPDDPEAVSMAVGAASILERAKVYLSLKEAVGGAHWVLGTSQRQGKYRKEILTPRELRSWAVTLPQDHKIALLFGPERTGLENEDLNPCQKLVRIPTAPELPSLNLAQAVMVIAYELFFEDKTSSISERNTQRPSPAEYSHRLYSHMQDTLSKIGFLKAPADRRMMQKLRTLFNKATLTEEEVTLLQGILSQIDWKIIND